MGEYPYQFQRHPLKHDKVMTLKARLVLFFFTFSCIFGKQKKKFSSFFPQRMQDILFEDLTNFQCSILLQRQVMKKKRQKLGVFCGFF